MICRTDPLDGHVVAVSNPGGMARHFRVQVQSHPGEKWEKFATFGHKDSAQTCLAELLDRGVAARLVEFRITPTAA